MKLYGQDVKKNEILKRVGDISQLGGSKVYELTDGAGRGIRAVDIKTPSGIDMSILIDRAMDISSLFYKNTPLVWKSAVKEISGAYYDSKGIDWLRIFFGGLLTTCGLSNVGAPCTDSGEEFGLHGRITTLPAELISIENQWEDDDFIIEVCGKIRQSRVFGEKLEITRKISCSFTKPEFLIEDLIENLGFEKTPLMLLYHINIGYPLLDKDSRLIEPQSEVLPKDAEAKKGLNDFDKFNTPVHGFKEQVFIHDIKADSNGKSSIALINESFNNGNGLGLSLSFNKDNLNYLIEWKQMGEGEYVCGLEPSNCGVLGRAEERKAGRLQFIEPGEVKKYKLEFKILESNKEIAQLKKKFGK
ncbi:MAG: aldose 1-epimerase family protein [Candidatus Humimicrobiaceae bacterium]